MIIPKSSRIPRLKSSLYILTDHVYFDTPEAYFYTHKGGYHHVTLLNTSRIPTNSNQRKLVHLPVLHSDVCSFKFVIFIIMPFMEFKIK